MFYWSFYSLISSSCFVCLWNVHCVLSASKVGCHVTINIMCVTVLTYCTWVCLSAVCMHASLLWPFSNGQEKKPADACGVKENELRDNRKMDKSLNNLPTTPSSHPPTQPALSVPTHNRSKLSLSPPDQSQTCFHSNEPAQRCH